MAYRNYTPITSHWSHKRSNSSSTLSSISTNSSSTSSSSSSSRRSVTCKFGLCPTCNRPNTHREWCRACNSERFRKKFSHWTSGSKLVDNFIKDSQLSAADNRKVLEWIPYSQFQNLKFVAEGGFAKVYFAEWQDGFIIKWNHKENNWERMSKWRVALKILYNSNTLSSEFFDEIKACVQCGGGFGLIRCYGISQEPDTGNYIIVLYYARHGNLRTYLDQHYGKLDWTCKLTILRQIAEGLKKIHHAGFVHRDFHSGNILQSKYSEIADLGLTGPANKDSTNRVIYGVLPYVAPEVLRGKGYTYESDIYSFGIIIWEVSGCLSPFGDRAHDAHLAMDICRGVRPDIEGCIPKPLVKLMKKCWDENPKKRPSSHELYLTLHKWYWDLKDGIENEVTRAFNTADNYNSQFPTPESSRPVSKTHPSAIYTSRLLNFPDLLEPVNAPNTSSIDIVTNEEDTEYRTRQFDEDLVYDSNRSSCQIERVTFVAEEEGKEDNDGYVTRQFDAELSLEGL